ncbi:MAG: hypothetical protein OXG81_13850 [Acidobacteria bacterium]|nr:hypothetical protein [Acidobacteriota bacterium]
MNGPRPVEAQSRRKRPRPAPVRRQPSQTVERRGNGARSAPPARGGCLFSLLAALLRPLRASKGGRNGSFGPDQRLEFMFRGVFVPFPGG